jgi:hypothetical protein
MGFFHGIYARIWQWRLRNNIFPPQEIGKGLDAEVLLNPPNIRIRTQLQGYDRKLPLKGVRITTGRKVCDTKLGGKILFKPNRRRKK